eukprot:TRINITY_DN432_c0_g1_i2.p1 TRINITY_DN432_c0_g1~~TRINITY_DN432_c0_g1_i2.p1  ORF type:complete len:202 (-),score=42.93 TRINITY_DN432_c0_g1_i2:77-682(-)
MDAGCPEEKRKTKSYVCHKCRAKDMVRQNCAFCEVHYCMSHLQPRDHDCPNDVSTVTNREEEKSVISSLISEAKKRFQSITGGNSNKKKKTRRAPPVGDNSVRRENRLILEVVYPLSDGEKTVEPILMFFDRQKRVGQILDEIARHGGIRNINNTSSNQKLYLISLKTGEPLVPRMKLQETDLEEYDAILLERLDKIDDLL